jgi:O-antigen ligase
MVSGSRAAFLGVVVGTIVIMVFANAGQRRRVLLVIGASLALLVVVSKAANWGPQMNPLNRLLESAQPRRSFEADWQRAHDLRLSGRLLSNDPLTGYGMENIDAMEPPTKGAFHLPHFILLQSWVAGGIVALLGNLWLYAATLWLGLRAVRERRVMAVGLLASCAAFMLMDLVAPGMDQRFKWFAGALLFATLGTTAPSSRPEPLATSTP